jgi:hypothetical protein
MVSEGEALDALQPLLRQRRCELFRRIGEELVVVVAECRPGAVILSKLRGGRQGLLPDVMVIADEVDLQLAEAMTSFIG